MPTPSSGEIECYPMQLGFTDAKPVASIQDVDPKEPDPFESWGTTFNENLLLSRVLAWVAKHQRDVESWRMSYEDDARYYSLPLVEVFRLAEGTYPSVSISAEVMGGAPCIRGTRIPVYMVLDAIEYHGSLEGAIKSYPRLTMEQVREAIGFSKIVLECPLGDEA